MHDIQLEKSFRNVATPQERTTSLTLASLLRSFYRTVIFSERSVTRGPAESRNDLLGFHFPSHYHPHVHDALRSRSPLSAKHHVSHARAMHLLRFSQSVWSFLSRNGLRAETPSSHLLSSLPKALSSHTFEPKIRENQNSSLRIDESKKNLRRRAP
jgi:hypothetical protein